MNTTEQLRSAKALIDGVRERHGVQCVNRQITIWEDGEHVGLDSSLDVRWMTHQQARYLASKLYRLSRRIRDRAIDDAKQSEVQDA